MVGTARRTRLNLLTGRRPDRGFGGGLVCHRAPAVAADVRASPSGAAACHSPGELPGPTTGPGRACDRKVGSASWVAIHVQD